MLQQIMPEQIRSFWPKIKDLVDETLPRINGDSPNRINNVFAELLIGSMILWVSFHTKNGKRNSDAIVITKIVVDEINDTKNVLIFCLASIGGVIPETSYEEGFEALGRYGRAHGCKNVTGYLLDDFLLNRVKQLGGGFVQSYIAIPL